MCALGTGGHSQKSTWLKQSRDTVLLEACHNPMIVPTRRNDKEQWHNSQEIMTMEEMSSLIDEFYDEAVDGKETQKESRITGKEKREPKKRAKRGKRVDGPNVRGAKKALELHPSGTKRSTRSKP